MCDRPPALSVGVCTTQRRTRRRSPSGAGDACSGAWSTLSCSRPRRVALVGALLFVIVGVIGGPAPGSFGASNAFDDPGSQATRARERIERATGEAASAGVIALVRAPRSSAEVALVARTLRADPGIARVSLPPPSGPSAAVSRDGRQVLVAATLRAGASDVVKRLHRAFAGDHAVALGGTAVAGEQTGAQATSSLAIAELIAFPLLALLSLAGVPRGGGVAAARDRWVQRPRSVRRVARDQLGAVALAVRAEPGDRSRSRAGDRLQPVLRLTVPRGARPGRGRPLGRASDRCRPPGGRCCSVR